MGKIINILQASIMGTLVSFCILIVAAQMGNEYAYHLLLDGAIQMDIFTSYLNRLGA